MDPRVALERLAGGRFFEELNAAIIDVGEEVVASGKKGTVTVTLTLSKASKDNPMLVVEEVISRRPPREDPRGALYFVLDGELHREDPRQTKLDGLREVPDAGVEIRQADERQTEIRKVRGEE